MAGEQQDLIKRADGLLDAFNAADWQRFAADLAPDVVYEETGTQRHVDGVGRLCPAVPRVEAGLP